jgi:murein DD-endopeptidase MepM/ murein hydrolase activator NlpD
VLGLEVNVRKFPFLILLVAVLITFAPRATHAAPAHIPDCATQSSNLVALGRPLPEARLIASTNPIYTTPPTPSAPASPQPAPVTYTVQAGDTLSIIASRYQTTVYAIMEANNLINPNLIHRGQVLVIPVAGSPSTPLARPAAAKLTAPFAEVWMVGEAWQGEAATMWLKVAPGFTVSGTYGTQKIPFRANCELWWGMVSFDVFDAPGVHSLTLTATAANGRITTTALPILLNQVPYRRGPQVVYPPDRQVLLDPDTLRAENQLLYDLFDSIPDSPPFWDATFRKPIDSVITQGFGSTGMRDGRPVSYHEGVDLRAREPLPLYASARGIVILSELMTVRGNVIYIYHGAGVVTGYFHLSERHVNVGDTVAAGQQLGLTGNTGLSTAAHLHWEMRVNGRWVNPMPWLTRVP